jgi:hypothetical protein
MARPQGAGYRSEDRISEIRHDGSTALTSGDREALTVRPARD